MDALFRQQFPKHKDLKDWKSTELRPSYKKSVSDHERQLFLLCGNKPKNFDISNMMIINPFIGDKKKWYRIQVAKRCNTFYKYPKNTNFKDFFNHYKVNYKKFVTSEIKGVDYSFDFLKFLQDKKEREKLCHFLKININTRMENYLKHYIDCHGNFFNRLIR